MYNKLKKAKVNYEIEDLYKNGIAMGTKIVIIIPTNNR